MQQLLTGKKRFAGFEGEWEEVQFDEIVVGTQLGTTERKKESNEVECIPLLKMGNLTWGKFSYDKLETIPRNKAEKSLLLRKGDFLFNTRNTPDLVGKSAVWKGKYELATFDNNINRIHFSDLVNNEYMCLYLTNGKGKALIQSLPAGSTSVAAIYWKDLKNIRIKLPALKEQNKVSELLKVSDNELEILEFKAKQFKQEKKALMQQLLTGKRRVKLDA